MRAVPSAALSAQHYGLDRPLIVEAASHARRFVATAAAGDAKPIDPVSSATAARSFVDDLFRSGHVDYGDFKSSDTPSQSFARNSRCTY